MACCLSPCCPTRRPPGGSSSKRVRPVPDAPPAVPTSGDLHRVKLQPSSDVIRTPKLITNERIAATPVDDFEANVTSLKMAPPPSTVTSSSAVVSDFMSVFFKNCEQIARDNQATLHRALILDDTSRRTTLTVARRQTGTDDDVEQFDSASSISSVDQPPTAASYGSLLSGSNEVTSCTSSPTGSEPRHNHQHPSETTAFIAPANSPASSRPVTPRCSGGQLAATITYSSDGGRTATSGTRRTRHSKRRTQLVAQHVVDKSTTSCVRRHNPASLPRYHVGLGSRPPCLGQECSPIRSTPCGSGTNCTEPLMVDDLRRYQHCTHHVCHTKAVLPVGCDPPPPVVQRSCQKVDRWLRCLENTEDDDADRRASSFVVEHDDSRATTHRRGVYVNGLKRKSLQNDLDFESPLECSRSRRENIARSDVSGGAHRNLRCRRRQHQQHPGDDSDATFRRRSSAASTSGVGKTSSSGRRRRTASDFVGCNGNPSLANSSGWLADQSSSAVTPSGDCHSDVRRHRHLCRIDDHGTTRQCLSADGHRGLTADSSKLCAGLVLRRRQLVVRRRLHHQLAAAGDAVRSSKSKLFVETLAVL